MRIGDSNNTIRQITPQDVTPCKGAISDTVRDIRHTWWSVTNYSNKEAGQLSKYQAVKIDRDMMDTEAWTVVHKIDHFVRKGEVLNETGVEPGGGPLTKVYDLFLSFLAFMNLPADFKHRMAKELDEGYCHGSGLEIIRQLKETPDTNAKDLLKNLNKGNVAGLQLIHTMRCQLNRRIGHLEAMQGLLENPPAEGVPKAAKKAGIPKEVRKLNLDEVKTQIEGAKAIRSQANGSQTQLLGGRHEIRFLNMKAGASVDVRKAALERKIPVLTTTPVLISLHPEGEGTGHTMVLDLANNRFYDNNKGWYKYESPEATISNFMRYVGITYAELNGDWELRALAQPDVPLAPVQSAHASLVTANVERLAEARATGDVQNVPLMKRVATLAPSLLTLYHAFIADEAPPAIETQDFRPALDQACLIVQDDHAFVLDLPNGQIFDKEGQPHKVLTPGDVSNWLKAKDLKDPTWNLYPL